MVSFDHHVDVLEVSEIVAVPTAAQSADQDEVFPSALKKQTSIQVSEEDKVSSSQSHRAASHRQM